MEPKPLLRDAGIEPTAEVIAAALGPANSAFVEFNEQAKAHDIEVDWRFYKDGNAWLGKALYRWVTSRGTQKQLTAFWLSVWDGYFRVGFTFPERARAQVLALPLGPQTKARAEAAEQTGKLKIFSLYFDTCTDELFEDIFALIELKKSLR